MKITKVIPLIFAFLSACIDPSKAQNKAKVVKNMANQIQKKFSDVPVVSIEELQKLQKSTDKFILVDTREAYEQKVSMLPGAITKEEFLRNKTNYTNHKVIAYCTIGYRSSEFAKEMKKQGLNAFNLKESLLGWAHRQQPFVRNGVQTTKAHVYGEPWNLLPDNYQGIFE